jgi:hypothetical protein
LSFTKQPVASRRVTLFLENEMSKKLPTVCVDLDGLLADYSKGWQGEGIIGDPLPGAVQFPKDLCEFADIIIFTTRCKADVFGKPREGFPLEILVQSVKDWLDHHGFSYSEIYQGQGKPIAHCMVDDRAVWCDGSNYDEALIKIKRFCNFEQDNPDSKSAPAKIS